MSESAVQAQCLSVLRTHPYIAHVWRANTGGGIVQNPSGKKRFVKFGEAGVPDIIGFTIDGKFIGVEVKKPEYYKRTGEKKDATKRLSDHQARFLSTLGKANGIAIIADDADELKKELFSLMNK